MPGNDSDFTFGVLALGPAGRQAAQGAQVVLPPAGQSPQNVRVPRVGRLLFASPNAIKVGASSDHERSTPLSPCTRHFPAE